jgi:hypothetical protein
MRAHRVDYAHVAIWCPGCSEAHMLTTNPAGWTFNGDYDAPTFSPSVKVTGNERITEGEHAVLMAGGTVTPRPRCCHSFIVAGRIQFLPDSTHTLAGQTVELPEWDDVDVDA